MTQFVVYAEDEETRKAAEDALDAAMEGLVRQVIVPEISAIADASNLPPGFKEHLTVRRRGRLEFSVGNSWKKVADGEVLPLALWFEEGTEGHEVAARRAPLMTWVNLPTSFKPDPPNAGKRGFSKRHYVRGIPRTMAMARGIQESRRRFVEAGRKTIEAALNA